MDVDTDPAAAASNVEHWLARFSPVVGPRPSGFPFASHKVQSIESRRARMSDLLIFDVLLIRGGVRSPDILFPPTDWVGLRKLLHAIDDSVYDTLKKDCLVYILLRWAWDTDSKETNPGWDVRYVQDRCIAPQFVALADAYWLLDTGAHLTKAVSILADARLNRDYVSKILQALALSSSPTSSAGGASLTAATLIVKYVRTAKPLLTEPDDIDIYTLSLAQLSFMDAWAYQKSFPEGSDTRERLLSKILGWCLMPIPKKEPLAQLLAFPLSPYEQSSLHMLALPPQFLSSSSLTGANRVTSSNLVLSSQALSILQDLLCVRAIQAGDYVRAIKLDRQFSSVSPSLGSGASSSSIAFQTISSGRDTIDRKSIIQDLFATLPPAERTVLEDEIGKVATGVRANPTLPMTPRQGTSTTKRPLMAESSLSASWDDVGMDMGSPATSISVSRLSPAVSAGSMGETTPVPMSMIGRVGQSPASPFGSRVPRPQLASGHQALPIPKFTAFGSPIPPARGSNAGRSVVSERGKTLFSTSAANRSTTATKPATRVSLFDTAGSAKTAPNAFYKPPSVPVARTSLNVGGALVSNSTVKSAGQGIDTPEPNGKTQACNSDDEDMSMASGSDVEIVEGDHRRAADREEQDGGATTHEDEDSVENFITHDNSGAADLSFHTRHIDKAMDEVHGVGQDLGFSVFSGSRNAAQNGSPGRSRKDMIRNGHAAYASPPPRVHVSPSREGDKGLGISFKPTASTTSRSRAPPGAFHDEEEDEEEDRREHETKDADGVESDEGDLASLTTPTHSPRRSTRTGTQAETSRRSQSQRSSRNTTTIGTTSGIDRSSARTRQASSSRPSTNQTIPGSLMDEDNDEHGQDDVYRMDTGGDEDTEIDEQEEEDDAIAPLPSPSSRRTRSSGHVGATTTKSKPSAKMAASASATAAKGKVKARPSEAKTPTRRSSRLSTASSASPDHNEVASPTKKGRKSTGAKAPVSGGGSGTVATRSSTRRKR